MDDVRATCATINPTIFACTESWLSELKHTDEDVAVNYYSCIRNDRSDGRIGGGVAVWISHNIIFEIISSPFCAPTSINHVLCVFPQMKLLFSCVYIPPQQTSESTKSINDYFINTFDHLLNKYSYFNVCICADSNRFEVANLCSFLDLIDVESPPTFGNARLDRFLFSSSFSQLQNNDIQIGPPIDNASHSHSSLLCKLHLVMKINNVKTNKIFDLRPFHVNRFIDKLSSVNWCHIYDSDVSVDDKCNFFNSRISECMKEIPISYIPTSTKDKPWITPLIKHLIHKRWYAFRCRDFLKYNNLKKLIKIKINQAKLNWTNKFSHPADLWNKVNQMKGIKQTTPIDNLLNSYEMIV
jgi:hypothetical protein